MSEDKKINRSANDRFIHMAQKYSGKAVRPLHLDGVYNPDGLFNADSIDAEYRADGYINLMNKYGTSKDTTEHYHYVPELLVPDEQLEQIYEGNGLFAKIIDAPAEEAVKHGFTLKGWKEEQSNFVMSALDELDYEETVISSLKWSRLFAGGIAVLLINDGRGIDEPLDWKHIQSIDDIRIYDRSVVQPDYTTMFSYSPEDPFRTRGSRLGEPEYYHVYSKYGAFTVHESRCLVFRQGKLPEKCTNSTYEYWGIPEYIRIKRALRDTELAHSNGVKMLDKAVQPIYKMKNLSQELATEEGENNVLKRLQAIDLARGMLDSIAIDAEGEEYDFRTFQYTGVGEVINVACNYLSALTNIPQTILFGRSPAGMDATGNADLENWYNYIERIQKKTIKSNLRYLISIICQAGVATGELDKVPDDIQIEFNPLWSLSETEQSALDQTKAATAQTRAATAQMYVGMGVVDPSEVRKGLAAEGDFNIEEVIEEDYSDDDLFANMNQMQGGNSPDAAPAATKLPQDMTGEEKAEAGEQPATLSAQSEETEQNRAKQKKIEEEPDNTDAEEMPETAYETPEHMSVGVIIVSQGRILNATRNNDTKHGQICGPGGHIEQGETAEQAAIRETQEEFGITPSQLIRLGYGPMERDTGLSPVVFLCTNYTGKVKCDEEEMIYPRFSTLKELEMMDAWLYKPFKYGIELMKSELGFEPEEGSQTNLDAEDDDIQWITTETGVHIPLKDGTAVGGPLKGEDFSQAKSEKNSSTTTNSNKSQDIDLPKYLGEKEYRWLQRKSGSVIGGWGLKRAEDRYLTDQGFSDETLKNIDVLIANHSSNGRKVQKKADARIVRHIQENDEVGKAFIAKSKFEMACYEEWKKHNTDSKQLNKDGELRVYRTGDRKEGVECWTCSEDGADGFAAWNNASTVEQLQREGYFVIGGFATMTGAIGDAEITFIKAEVDPDAENARIEREATQSAFSKRLYEERQGVLDGDLSDQALFLYDEGYLAHDDAIRAMNDGSATKIVKEYFEILEENGDTTSTKPLADNHSPIQQMVNTGKYDWQSARVAHVEKITGASHEEAVEMEKTLQEWTGFGYNHADTAQIDKFIEQSNTYKGDIYRGLHFEQGGFDDFINSCEPGAVIGGNGKNTSWASDYEDALRFSHKSQDDIDSAIIVCKKNRTSAPISFANWQGESEVVAHSKAQWTVINKKVRNKGDGGRHAVITVIERGEYQE